VFATTYGVDTTFPPGNTLDPTNCNPGDTYCKVAAPLADSFATNFSGSGNLTTTGTITTGTLTIGNVYTLPTSAGSANKYLGYNSSGVLGWQTVSSSYTGTANRITYTAADGSLTDSENFGFTGTQLTIKNTSSLESATLGSELASSSGWTLGNGWSGDYNTGFDHRTTAPLVETLSFSMGSTGTNTYQVVFTVTSASSNYDLTVTLGNSEPFSLYTGAATTVTYTVGIKSVSNGDLVFTPGTTFDGLITNISVKQVTSVYNPLITIKDSAGSASLEIRQSTSSLKNLFFGLRAGRFNTSGYENVAFGTDTLIYNTSGFWNTAIGSQTLYHNTVGSRNIAVGLNSLTSNISGQRNIGVGTFSLTDNTTGNYNIAIGADSVWNNTTGTGNIGIGFQTLANNVTGDYNTALGYGAGAGGTGSNNVFLGYKAGYASTTSDNLYIDGLGRSSTNSLIYGKFSETSGEQFLRVNGNFGVGTQSFQTTPDTLVEFYESVAGASYPLMLRNANGAANSSVVLTFNNTGSTTAIRGAQIGSIRTDAESSGSSDLYFSTTYSTQAIGERMRITSKGLVGIGTGATVNARLESRSTTTEQLRLSYDATNYTSFTASNAGDLTIVPSGGDVSVTGTLAATTLITGVESTSPSGACTNGSIKISSSATTPGIYYCYGGAWHYSDQTGGFQIPSHESVDPVSGEQMTVGDFVIPMVDKVYEDGTAHGVWARWSTVKAQLLAEVGASTTSTWSGAVAAGTVSGVNTTTLTEKVTNVLSSLGITISNGVTSIAKLTTTNLTATTADIGQMQMTDKTTGEKYCIWISNGEWEKVKGECGSIITIATQETSNISTAETATTTTTAIQALEAATEVAQQAVETATQQLDEQIERQVQEEVAQQLEEQAAAQAVETSNAEESEIIGNQTITAAEIIEPATAETSATETTTTETTTEETPSVGELIQESTSSLLDGMWKFIQWIYTLIF